ncbi:MAG: bifunctional 23S rRNA (guanine(2069)-N(7))-methyltransferase RlmK/23S rRNA (guanine(2445)-N(2))-methyltransferase RlmL [Spirochaetaceae bacterium]|nr:MAG: bifunctional 23S rRNA (guanine(2069)-N(7))-methyltransferase RlmK/23S rRNA (guanine(2445)-N(2))-methyltransferase RlmL [Spirochaetaceae bacterium]
MTEQFTLFVSCPLFSEALLADELTSISSVRDITPGNSGVRCTATTEDVYRICLWSRLAGRVLLQLAEGLVYNREELYACAAAVTWETHLGPDATIAVAATGSHSAFSHSNMPVLIVKDAIVDRMRTAHGRRPSVDVQHPDMRIAVHLTSIGATLSLDLTGESLHRRGYRTDGVEAPLRENTAASVLIRSGWADAMERLHRGGGLSYPAVCADPMCGSGTLAVEAALMAADRAPNLDREDFGFLRWWGHQGETWDRVRQEARERAAVGRLTFLESGSRIWASDRDSVAVQAARRNAARVGRVAREVGEAGGDGDVSHSVRIADLIEFQEAEFQTLSRSVVLGPLKKQLKGVTDAPLFLVTNPPYGVRLTPDDPSDDASVLYAELGEWMSRSFAGFRATVLAADREQARHLGLRADSVYALYNGGLKIVAAGLTLDRSNRYSPPDSGPRRKQRQADEDPSTGVPMLVSRLQKNRKRLKTYLREHGVSCYRLYDADIPQHAAAVDVYTDVDGMEYAVVQEYAPPKTVDERAAEERFEELCEAVARVLEIPAAQVFTRTRRRQRGSAQYEPLWNAESEIVVVVEDELLFEVNLTDYLDTGLFMDKRSARELIGGRAAGTRFLNLFAYTCSVSVYAAAGGAKETVSVDRSNTYLDWGARNFGLNGIEDDVHRFIRADAREYLASDCGVFDLMYIDPPSFSNRKGDPEIFDVQRDHYTLLERALSHLSPAGEIYFATNLRGFRLSEELQNIARVEDISAETLPPDFERSFRNHALFRVGRL